MKIVVNFTFLLSLSFLNSQALDPRYHTLDEINDLLDSLDLIEDYDDIYHLETIGYSSHENLPIKAVKISDNASTKEDEGRVLFLGQCHAEEILGVETVIELIKYLLDPPASDAQHVNILRQNLEIWIIPTHNPEGLNVVHTGLDVSYRKNKTDFSSTGPYPNGVFDYDPAIGNDIDGVDLNRNYDFNWALGDTFLEPDASDYAAHYDYYRGMEPWSESEIVAIRDLAIENDFLFSIAWHSSRSGRLSEKVFTSWNWEGAKFPPDTQEMIIIGDEIASRIVKEDGVENYESVYSGSRNGKAHDWFYSATGCFQYLIECGTANLQPDSSALIEDTIDRLMPAQIYLLDRA
ncbi:MAG: M14 family zinc carboxypeptidase, partial [Candidatus Marinimicrobia bacterium]|nr:M14 family zinc carboxypeptidase [Candidatus Neomarinimicrobiota bacterium]